MDLSRIPSPCYVIDEEVLTQNLITLRKVQEDTGCKILLALKGFAMWSTFPLISKYLVGITASSVAEAMLGRDEFGGEVHAYAPAYSERDIDELTPIVHHLVFNSLNQFHHYRDRVRASGRNISMGIRVNPEYSEVETDIYNPCAPCSRLGALADQIKSQDLHGLEGLHFHTMCEQNADVLERTLPHFEEKFGDLIPQMKWINLGGGHHITREDYDIDCLCRTVKNFREKWGKEIYLEPGEAIALNTGVLVASVLDIVQNKLPIAILDVSATAHMPDVLEMPYRPVITGAHEPAVKSCTYRLGGLTCLAGDVIGDYSFGEPLQPGDKLVFEDMAHYTMVKNTTFNGVRLPSIGIWKPRENRFHLVREFGYEDYRDRLS
ncbi:MAG: carboxynorspermidine decarboxylase [Verrucomicrobiales bacterium]|mgnify:FL=1|nr:carboxynorspermidine decarboxylase [Verrucomicrobiales bacterium]|tara:strand:+ start:4361 stop:5494 length:1134 start_codon:yes stop_codon:yes gene_type:complete